MSYVDNCGTPGYGNSAGVILVLYVLLVIILATFY
ncbi:YjcZ family sporulation protein [Paenibacillus pectinilyticus]|nr:YjcZ family sporulation protein [Paenibacillus pectinilyticus]